MTQTDFFQKIQKGIDTIPDPVLKQHVQSLGQQLTPEIQKLLPLDIPGTIIARWSDPDEQTPGDFNVEMIHPIYRVGMIWDVQNNDSWWVVGKNFYLEDGPLHSSEDCNNLVKNWINILNILGIKENPTSHT